MENRKDLSKWSDQALLQWKFNHLHSMGNISFDDSIFAAEVDGEILRRNLKLNDKNKKQKTDTIRRFGYSDAIVVKYPNKRIIVGGIANKRDILPAVCLHIMDRSDDLEPRARHKVIRNKVVRTSINLSETAAYMMLTALNDYFYNKDNMKIDTDEGLIPYAEYSEKILKEKK